MPNELLKSILSEAWPKKSTLRQDVQTQLGLGLVCKTWYAVAEALAWESIEVDAEDVRLVDFLLSPTGQRVSTLVTRLELNTSKPNPPRADSEPDDEEEIADAGDDDKESERKKEEWPPKVDEAMADKLATIALQCQALQTLKATYDTEPVVRKLTAHASFETLWPDLRNIFLHLIGEFWETLPILSAFTQRDNIKQFVLRLAASDETDVDPDGLKTKRAIEQYPLRPLEKLEYLMVECWAIATIALPAVFRVVSPRAPLVSVQTSGFAPTADFFRALGQGTSELTTLRFSPIDVDDDFKLNVLPNLHLLGLRRIKSFSFTFGPSRHSTSVLLTFGAPPEAMPGAGEFLKSLPLGIEATNALSDTMGLGFATPFRADDALNEIMARPPAPVLTIFDKEHCEMIYDNKPLLQKVFLHATSLPGQRTIFARFGELVDPDKVSEWVRVDQTLIVDGAGRPYKGKGNAAKEEEEEEEKTAGEAAAEAE